MTLDMFKTKAFFLFFNFLFFTLFTFSQDVKVENGQFEIKIKTVRKVKKITASTVVFLNSNTLKNIFVKVEVHSIDGNKKELDINKFILLDNENMLKIRPNTISYQEFTTYYSFEKLTKDEKFIDSEGILRYDNTIKDSFLEYNFDGYETLETPVNYGTRRKPEVHVVYFRPKSFKKKKINLFFAFPKDTYKGTLYYGDKKIAGLKFK